MRRRIRNQTRPVILQKRAFSMLFSLIHLLSKDIVTVSFSGTRPFERQLIQQALHKYLLFHTKRHLEERQELNVKPFSLISHGTD